VKTIPYWSDHFPRPADLYTSEPPFQVDVAVIGGGYTGLSAARALASSGASVAVLERHSIGWGASSRNGGLSTTGLKQSISVIFKRYGEKLGREFWQASLDAIDLIDEIVRDEQLECDFQRTGHMALAARASHFKGMQKHAVWLREKLKHEVHVISPEELRSEIGSDTFHGGLVDEYSASLHPAKYVFGLARSAGRLGAHLCEETAVTGFTTHPSGFDVHTSRGTLKATEVVMATNGYTDMLIPNLKARVFPVGSYIIVTDPLPQELQRTLSPKGRAFYDSKRLLNYFRLTPDGRMLFGGRNNLDTDLDLGESARILRGQMVRVFPELEDARLTYSWTGQLGITFDLMPHIGRVNGIHYAFGYGEHGVSTASFLGTEIGLLLAGTKKSSPFMMIPHQTRFFYRGRPWFIPLVAFYYRILDWLT
jgi:glycine/D-amino acid oxidase-like deaminating enzyme